jgi:acetyl-CoA acetyltransferase family protein
MKEPVYIVDGLRTPFAKAGTTLAGIDSVELGKTAFSILLARSGIDPARIAEVIIGCVAQPADAANIARVVALRSGVPETIPAITVHRNCASGFESITHAAEKMAAGRGDIFLVGGVENMSQIPIFYPQETARKFGELARAKTVSQRVLAFSRFRPSDLRPRIGLQLGLFDPVSGLNMGQTAEVLGREFEITREAQDQFALKSHSKAIAGRERLGEEITPVFLTRAKSGPGFMAQDNGPRENQTMEALAKLKPVFEPRTGTVTAGNSSQITDGAVALLLMTEKGLKQTGLTPLGQLLDYAYVGLDPARMGLGPAYAINRAEQQCGLRVKDADLIEVNEAFAAQVIACQKAVLSVDFGRTELNRSTALGEIPDEILNVNGGSIALGHPVGVTGSRLVLTALKELHRRNGQRALVTLCVGGGQGGALWLAAR